MATDTTFDRPTAVRDFIQQRAQPALINSFPNEAQPSRTDQLNSDINTLWEWIKNGVNVNHPDYNRLKNVFNNLNSEFSTSVKAQQDAVDAVKAQQQKEADATVQSDLANQINDLYTGAANSGVQKIQQNYIPQRQKLINEEATAGRLKDPASIINLSGLDRQQSSDTSNYLGNLDLQHTANNYDLSKTIAGLIQNQNQFDTTNILNEQKLAETKRQFDQSANLQNKSLDLATALGNLRAQQAQPGWTDYLPLAIGAASGIAGTGLTISQLMGQNQKNTAAKQTAGVGGYSGY